MDLIRAGWRIVAAEMIPSGSATLLFDKVAAVTTCDPHRVFNPQLTSHLFLTYA